MDRTLKIDHVTVERTEPPLYVSLLRPKIYEQTFLIYTTNLTGAAIFAFNDIPRNLYSELFLHCRKFVIFPKSVSV